MRKEKGTTIFMLSTMSNHLIFFLIFLSLFFTSSRGRESRDQRCPNTTCGDIHIRYPFWLKSYSSSKSEDVGCGFKDFGLECSEQKELAIQLPSDRFLVRGIDYDKSTVDLVDANVLSQECPRARHNITTGSLPLAYASRDINITFFFNCTDYPLDLPHIRCLSSGSNRSFVIEQGKELDSMGTDWTNECQETVVVVVQRAAIAGIDLFSAFGTAMQSGFQLGWNTRRNCGACEANGGLCGFNSTDGEFLCICKDGNLQSQRCPASSFNLRRKVIIGVVAGVTSGLAVGAACYFYQRRRRTFSGSSKLLSYFSSSFASSKFSNAERGEIRGVHLFTYEELQEATGNFDPSKELGEGGFGKVYHGVLRDHREVAVKRLYENSLRRVEQFLNEVELLTRLRHTNLVVLYGCTSRSSRELLLVYEYISNGTLADHLHGSRCMPGSLPWSVRLRIATEAAHALTYLHSSDIIHRDVKSCNILLDANFSVKVADFGLSRLFPTGKSHVSTAPQGTPGYLDPEYHRYYQLTDKSDVFSFGVVLVELISSMPAVDITRRREEINLSSMAIGKIRGHALHEFVDTSLGYGSDEKVRLSVTAVAELAFRCLQGEKEMRPTMAELLEDLERNQEQYSGEGQKVKEGSKTPDTVDDDVKLLKKVVRSAKSSPVTVMEEWSTSCSSCTSSDPSTH